MVQAASAPPTWDFEHVRQAVDAAGAALWSWNVDTDQLIMDERAYALWDVPPASSVTFADLSEKIHPSDRDRVRAGFLATRGLVGLYEIDFRILKGDVIVWISARGQGDDAGIKARKVVGMFLDVTGRKQAEEANELLAGEMSHRVKNLLTIASALTRLTSRDSATTTEMAERLTHRLTQLGRAHDLVRPLPGAKTSGALLGDLLAILLDPYNDMGAFSGRVRISVPRTPVGEGGATAMAMVIHELATNSVKYGSLSVAEGSLDVSCLDAEGDTIAIVWTERGGPAVSTPTAVEGYGSKLIARSVSSQLGGSISTDWSPEGAIVTLKINRDRLNR